MEYLSWLMRWKTEDGWHIESGCNSRKNSGEAQNEWGQLLMCDKGKCALETQHLGRKQQRGDSFRTALPKFRNSAVRLAQDKMSLHSSGRYREEGAVCSHALFLPLESELGRTSWCWLYDINQSRCASTCARVVHKSHSDAWRVFRVSNVSSTFEVI